MIAIIGYSGFVGGYLWENLPEADLYNSKNIKEIKNLHYDTIFFSGIPAEKWFANKNPLLDFENIQNIIAVLDTVSCNNFICISTIDVHNDNFYGKHRLFFEKWVIQKYKNVRIYRLPALIGHGLKKNVIFDYVNDRKLSVNKDSIFQWYNLENLWSDITNNSIENINEFYSEPIKISHIIEDENVFEYNSAIVIYNYKPTYKSNLSVNEILDFIKLLKLNKSKLAVSNLMWNCKHDLYALNILKRYGIKNIELVPTKYFGGIWEQIFKNSEFIKKNYSDFNIVSLQCIFYGIKGNLKNNYNEYIEHFKKISIFANELNVKILVLGSPKIRENEEIFIKFLNEISDIWKNGFICVENNSKKYGCNVGTSLKEVKNIVEKVGKYNIKINYDTGNAIMENEKITEFDDDLIHHCQISMPYLEELNNKEFKYPTNTQFISLEIKELQNIITFAKNIKKFLNIFI